MTAHLLGFTDVDDNGQEGLELELQDKLGGKAGSERVIKDRRGTYCRGCGQYTRT
ncbi:MAG: hypothetical protein WDM70_00315 [Nitrosomonadales bacterium]